jgi:hypothetical protein
MMPYLISAILRHHPAVLFVVFTAPVKMIDCELKAAITPRNRVQDLDTGGYDFRPDAISGDCCDFV